MVSDLRSRAVRVFGSLFLSKTELTRPRAFVQNQHKKEVNERAKDITQTQQQRSESLTVTLTWHASKNKVHKLHQRYILVVLVENVANTVRSIFLADMLLVSGLWFGFSGEEFLGTPHHVQRMVLMGKGGAERQDSEEMRSFLIGRRL